MAFVVGRFRIASWVGCMVLLGGLVSVPAARAASGVSPPSRYDPGMVYDQARAQVVLFGGHSTSGLLADTWTWDGSAWLQESPASSPSARSAMGMAFDQARGLVVLFGGSPSSGVVLDDTWTWDGTTWTKASPTTSPPARSWGGMVYDEPRGEVVLFGGRDSSSQALADTWTWDGSTWTQESPASSPSARFREGLAYDEARGNVVLFGGWSDSFGSSLGDTWTWDGAEWTQQFPTTSPHARGSTGLTFDPAWGQLLLFGGGASGQYFADTWHWNGTTWTQQSGRRSPGLRDAMGLASDEARGEVVLFGGWAGLPLGDTWAWDGRGWSIPIQGVLQLAPESGPPGRSFRIGGSGFGAFESVSLVFLDSVAGQIPLGRFGSDGTGTFEALAIVPSEATVGPQQVRAIGMASRLKAVQTFTVTEPPRELGSRQ